MSCDKEYDALVRALVKQVERSIDPSKLFDRNGGLRMDSVADANELVYQIVSKSGAMQTREGWALVLQCCPEDFLNAAEAIHFNLCDWIDQRNLETVEGVMQDAAFWALFAHVEWVLRGKHWRK